MRSPKKKTEKHSFTLIELVAALAVMGFVSLIIGAASLSFYNAWKTSAVQTKMLKENQKIDTVMDSLVRNMIPFNWKDEENDTSSDLVFLGETGEIMFVSLRRSYSTENGGLIFVRLYCEDNSLIAEYSLYPRFPWRDTAADDPDMPWKREILAGNVQSVSFEYADRTSSRTVEWLEEWDNEEKKVIPLAVRMTLERTDGSKEYWLRRTAGSGANSVFGRRMESAGGR